VGNNTWDTWFGFCESLGLIYRKCDFSALKAAACNCTFAKYGLTICPKAILAQHEIQLNLVK
jgi:hypothetical protein